MSEANWEDTIKDIEVIIYTDNPDRFYRYCEFLETLDILLSEEGSDKSRIQDVKNNIQEQLTKERQQRRDEAWRIYRLPETSLQEKLVAGKRAIAPELFCGDNPKDTEEYKICEMLQDETWPDKRVELYLDYLEFYSETMLYQQSYEDQSKWLGKQRSELDRLKLWLNKRDANDKIQYVESIYSAIYTRKQDVDHLIIRIDSRELHKDFVPLIKRLEYDALKNPDFMVEAQMLREEYALYCLDVALIKFRDATGVNVNEWNPDKPCLKPDEVLRIIEDALRLGILNMMPNRMGQPGYEHLKLNDDRSIVPEAYFITSNNAARVEEFNKTKLALDQALDVTLELQAIYKKPDYEKTLSEIYKIQSIWSANEIQSLANFKQEQLAKDLEHKKSSLDDKLYRLTEADINHVIEAFEKSELNSLDALEQVRKYVSDKLNELKALRSRLSDYSKWTRDMSEMIEKAERLLKSSSVEVERIKPLVEKVEQELAQFELTPDLNDRWYDLRKAYNNLVGGQERFENVRKYYINGSWEDVITVGTYYKNSSALTDEDAPYHDEGHKMYLFAEANLAYSQAKKMGQLEEKRNTKLQKARESLAGLDDTWRGRNELFAQVEQLLFDTQKYQSDNAKARELSKEIAPTEDWLDRNEYVKALQKISDAEKEGDKAQYAILRDDTLKNWQTKIEQEITALQNERYFDNVSRSHIEKLKENIAALKEHGRSINVSLETSFNRKETQILLRDYEAEHRYRGEGLRKQRNYFGLPIKLGLNDYQSWLDILSKDFNAKNKDIAEISAYYEIAKICDEYGSLEDQLKKLEAFYNDLDGQEDIANHIIIDAILAGYESLISQKAANDKFTSKEQVDDYFAAMRKYQDLLLHRAGYGDEIAMLSHLWEDFIIAFETSLRLNRKQASVYNSDTRTSATKSFNELDKLNMRAKNYQASNSLWLGYRTCFMMSIVEERKRMDKAAIQSYLRTASISDGSLATLLEYAFILKEDKDNADEVLVQIIQNTIDDMTGQISKMYGNLQLQIDHAAFDSFVDSLSDSLKQLQGLEYQITAINKGLRGINNNDKKRAPNINFDALLTDVKGKRGLVKKTFDEYESAKRNFISLINAPMAENGRWNPDSVKKALDNADAACRELYNKAQNDLPPQKQLNEFKSNVENIFKILDQIISNRDVLQHALKGTIYNKQHEDGRTETIDYKFHEPKERFGDAKGALKDIENSSDAINKELKGMTTIFDGVVLEFVIPNSFLMTPTDIKLDIGHGEQLLNRVVGFEQHVIVTDKFLERGKIWQEKIEDIRENYAVYKTIRGKLDDWYKYMKALNEQVFKAQSAENLPELDDAYIEYWDDLLNYDRRYEPQSLDFDSLSDELSRFEAVMGNLESLIGVGQVNKIPHELKSYIRKQLDEVSSDLKMDYFDLPDLYKDLGLYMMSYKEKMDYVDVTKARYDRYLENLEKLLKDEQRQAQNTNVGGFLSKWFGHNNTPVPNTDAINNIRRVKAIFRCELYPG